MRLQHLRSQHLIATFLGITCFASLPGSAVAGHSGGKSPVQTGNKQSNYPRPPSPPASTQPDAAHEELISARNDLNTAQRAYDTAVKAQMATFEQSADFTAAQQAVKDASAAYETAQRPVLKALEQKPDYQQAVAAKAAADAKLKALEDSQGDRSQIAAAAEDSLTAKQALSTLERNAVANDDSLKPSLTALNDAQAKVAKLRADFQTSLKTQDDVAAAQKALDDAKSKLAAAEQKLASR
jgi:hypothetical protein